MQNFIYFSCKASDRYFIESANNISFFYETQAFNEDGTFKCDPEISLNKVGHAIHRLNSVFAQITFHEKIKNICRKLKMKKPAVIQSMYIYKNPKIGGQGMYIFLSIKTHISI